jgi:hypothetical protein
MLLLADNAAATAVRCLLQLSALVVSQLLQRCPNMRSSLRAAYLIGDTEPGGRSRCLSMDTVRRDFKHMAQW